MLIYKTEQLNKEQLDKYSKYLLNIFQKPFTIQNNIITIYDLNLKEFKDLKFWEENEIEHLFEEEKEKIDIFLYIKNVKLNNEKINKIPFKFKNLNDKSKEEINNFIKFKLGCKNKLTTSQKLKFYLKENNVLKEKIKINKDIEF